MRSHKALVKLARSHQTHEELKRRVSIFDTAWWKAEKERIKKRVRKTEAARKASGIDDE